MDNKFGFDSVSLSNTLCLIFFCLCCALPFILLLNFCWNRSKWGDQAFSQKYETLIGGTRFADAERYAIAVVCLNFAYFTRRMTLCLTLVLWQDFFWGQIFVCLMTSLILACLILATKPLDSSFSNRLEIFNEGMALLVLYMMMCFTDFIRQSSRRGTIGLIYCSLICVFAVVHLLFLITDSIRKTYKKI